MNGPLIVGDGGCVILKSIECVSLIFEVRLSRSSIIMVKFPDCLGFPLKIPERLNVSPGGTPFADQKVLGGICCRLVKVTFALGLGGLEGG
jgi:hypothetical protein